VRRLTLMAASILVLLTLLAPAAMAAGPVTSTGSVVVTVNGAADVPAGSNLDAVVVVDGTATISGTAETVVVVGGTATLANATVDQLVVIDGRVDLLAGTTVQDIRTIEGTVTQDPSAVVTGGMRSYESDLVALSLLLAPLALLFTAGLALAAVISGLLVAAFGARQVRRMEDRITQEPGQTLVAGIAGTIILPVIGALLTVTIIGAPVGLALLLGVLPVLAFAGWLVAAIWVGDWMLARGRGSRGTGHPYRAAVLGVVVLAVASIIPFVSTVATMFGFGALLLVAWDIVRPAPATAEPILPMQMAPSAG